MADRSVRKGVALIAVVLIAILAMLLMPKQAKKKIHPPNDDPWVLVSYNPDNKFGTYLGNGFISTRIMGDGVGSQNGKPLPCFMAGFYDDEKLIPIPTWSDLRFYDGKTQFKIDKEADYKQVLNMKTGILTTYATWRAGRKTLKGKIEVIVSRADSSMARLVAQLKPDFDGRIGIDASIGSSGGQTIAQNMAGIDHKDASITITLFSLARGKRKVTVATSLLAPGMVGACEAVRRDGVQHTSNADAKKGRSLAISKYVLVLPGDFRSNAPDENRVQDRVVVGDGDGFLSRHKAAWAKLWQRDIIIDGPKKDQQAIHSCMFYLLQSVREGSQWSIPPMGLSDNIYSGHVFWDADTWMFPALILQHPELARSIVDYRYNTLPGAMANAKASGYAGAEYAWESGMTGKEDTPPGLVYRNERHIDGDVALAQWQYFLATGDLNWLKTRGYPVLKATADYWVSRALLANGRYEIRQVVPPDENAELVNNSAYTNAIAKMNLEFASRAAKLTGQPANPKWASVAAKMYIPFDNKAKRFIAFDNYKGLKAKQADTELLAYPLQFDLPGQSMTYIYRNTFDYYAPKVLPKGPAMSSSAHSVIAARLKNCSEAYADFVKSYKPYLRGPFNYFNETPSEFRQSYCFLTGTAGPIQATIYGLAGAHMDYLPADPTRSELAFSPCLPKQWKNMTIKGVQWHGKTFDVSIGQGNSVTIGK